MSSVCDPSKARGTRQGGNAALRESHAARCDSLGRLQIRDRRTMTLQQPSRFEQYPIAALSCTWSLTCRRTTRQTTRRSRYEINSMASASMTRDGERVGRWFGAYENRGPDTVGNARTGVITLSTSLVSTSSAAKYVCATSRAAMQWRSSLRLISSIAYNACCL